MAQQTAQEQSDYKSLGLKIGIEIHQQLEGKKLFCECPTTIKKENPEFEVKRRLKAATGETGETDIAAKYEQEKKKYFVYQGYKDCTCLVELDEEPPHKINPDALKTCLQICKLLNCEIADVIQFMRKTVVDGSNTSGFQRTALVGKDGFVEIETKAGNKKIGIESVCLEEEACQIMERTKEYDVYNLSRLGIPLIEIATAPDISTSEECKETALKIGMILRSIEGIKRGIGTIRQDVNLSIKNGYRVEVKGFQEVRSIPAVVEHEINRQIEEIKNKKITGPHVRKAEPDFTTSYLRPMPGAARMYPETDVPIIIPDISLLTEVRLLSEKSEELVKLGLGKDLAEKTVKTKKDKLLDEIIKKCPGIKPAFIAETLVSYEPELQRKHQLSPEKIEKVDEESLKKIFEALNSGKITKDSVMLVIIDIAKGEEAKSAMKKYELISDRELEQEIKKIIAESKVTPLNALIGRAMGKLRGKADANKIIEMLKKLKG